MHGSWNLTKYLCMVPKVSKSYLEVNCIVFVLQGFLKVITGTPIPAYYDASIRLYELFFVQIIMHTAIAVQAKS